ncbi:MAG: ABC transporter substrate-binding protein [Gemmatimonadetes bacterium]|nr:ABC transporter substrate-binding protein [Gemmatimonadota bacterium]
MITVLTLLAPLYACTPVGGPEAAAPVSGEPPIVAGPISAQDESAAALELANAREAYRSGDYDAATAAARRVVDMYPRAPASSLALRILADASFQRRDYATAEAAATRYVSLFDASDARAVSLRLLAGRSQFARGNAVLALETLVRLPVDPRRPAVDSALAVIREIAHSLDRDELERTTEALRAQGRLVAPLLTEYAIALHFYGNTGEAETYAREVLTLDPPAEERRLTNALLEGRIEEALGGAPLIGTLLPSTGAAFLRESASQVEEGVRLALSLYQASARRPVQLQVHDDVASPQTDAELLATLERSGALAVIGPVFPPGLEAVARARRGVLPIISPTSRALPEGAEGVYSLMAPDPTPSRVIAEYARRSGIETVAVMYPRAVHAAFEAAAFTQAFRAQGGRIALELPYDSTTTTFQAPLTRVAELRPQALFLPLEERDIQIVAPQIAYYGLDSLGIRVLGTAAWAQEPLLRRVGARSTNGVVAATPTLADRPNEAYREFVEAYERTYQKTMRSALAPYGYDAARLILDTIRRGASTPAAVRRALESIRDFPGATGTISVTDGRIVRDHVLVRIEGGRVLPLAAGPR